MPTTTTTRRGVYKAGRLTHIVIPLLAIVAATAPTRAFAQKTTKCPPTTPEAPVMVEIATFEEVKDLPNHPEKVLIDVREPEELKETGQIPTSINIPRKGGEFWPKGSRISDPVSHRDRRTP